MLDVSRLVWRLWRGRLPTGIDRVCLAYLDEFARDSLAMLQWRDRRAVLGPARSDRLFALLAGGVDGLDKRALVRLVAGALPAAGMGRRDLGGRIYLNVGHTGLNVDSLPGWLERRNLRAVYLVHDLIPVTHPQYCREGEAGRHTQRMANALQSAAGIIVNSADTGNELRHFAHARSLPFPPQLVAHLGIEPLRRPGGPSPHPRPYYLCLGTIEARKNHIGLLEAWDLVRARLGEDAPDLVVIGQRGWEAGEAIARLDRPQPPHGRIVEMSRCDDGQLAAWITHARALLMPSHVEGYGLPVLEALSLGTPVLARDLEVFREIAGDIPTLLPEAPAAWADAIAEDLAGGADRARQLQGLHGYTPPSWAGHFAAVRDWLARLPAHR